MPIILVLIAFALIWHYATKEKEKLNDIVRNLDT